ncbi:MAG: sulfatase-like hydrolase/transferase [Myxococcota bacterium]
MSSLLLFALPAAAQSNYLVIIADDLGTDKISAYYTDFSAYTGAHLPVTPEIDTLASQGARFSRAWANPSCSPTRASLQTGVYAFRHGIGAALEDVDAGLVPTDWTGQLLGQLFAHAGFATGYFGKWHVGTKDAGGTGLPNELELTDEPHPVRLGYQRFHGTITGEMNPNYFDWPLVDWADGAGTFDAAPGVHSLIDTTDAASTWIGEVAAEDEPWLAVVAYHAPHSPNGDEGWRPGDLAAECVITEPCLVSGTCATTPGVKNDEEDLAVYRTLVECLDAEVGRLLDQIGPDELDDTIVVFMGDNGTPSDVQEGVFLANGGKGTVMEGGIRVPLVIADGGVRTGELTPDIPAGLVITDPVLTVDLHATLTHHAGITVTPETDSHTLHPCLTTGACGWGNKFRYTEKFDVAKPDSHIAAVGWGTDKMQVSMDDGCLLPAFYFTSGTSLDLPMVLGSAVRKDRLKNHFLGLHASDPSSWAYGLSFCE